VGDLEKIRYELYGDVSLNRVQSDLHASELEGRSDHDPSLQLKEEHNQNM